MQVNHKIYKKMISENISINKNLKQTKSNFEFENIKSDITL